MPSLEALAALEARGAVVLAGVVTQPDRPADRGRVAPSAVKRRATELGLAVLQPDRLDPEARAAVLALRPDALVWAAYGNRIPGALLAAVGGRALNVHASLLPRWRGAAPVAHAILAGDERTGVTLMEGTAGLDRGPLVASEAVTIGVGETAGELTDRLAALGGRLLERELLRYLDGAVVPRPQDEDRATWAPKLTPADGALSFAEPAEALARRVRATTPAPGAWTTFRGQRLVILRARVTGGPGVAHGTLALREGLPHVAAGAGWLRLDDLKPAGKRAMSGAAWVRGLRALGPDARLPS